MDFKCNERSNFSNLFIFSKDVWFTEKKDKERNN